MDDDTIAFLRTLCAKVKEIATICDAYLENQSRKNRKILPKELADDPKPIGNRLIPISKWKDFHPWPTAGSLRSMIFSSYKTGADFFVRKVGRRNLICEKSFFEWVNMSEDQRIKASSNASRWKDKYGKK